MINRLIRFFGGTIKEEQVLVTKFVEPKTEKKSGREIERKFLMKSFPDDRLFLIEASLTNQAYLSVEPEVRIRSKIYEDGTSDCTETIKGNGSLTRAEIEISLTEQQFDNILRLVDKSPIEKVCRMYLLEDGSKLEVSYVDHAFYYAEVEFESEKQAEKWEPTSVMKEYVIKEVTYDSEYKMKNYWNRTRLGSDAGKS